MHDMTAKQDSQTTKTSASPATTGQLWPVLSISTNQTGSHRTLYPVGTRADALVHDFDARTGEPTYAEGVYVEMVTESQAAEVRAAGVKGLHFSDSGDFNEWLCGERSGQ